MSVASSPWPREEPAQARPSPAAASPELSIVVPVFNEAENIEPLYRGLVAALAELGRSYEILAVDDGSTDTTFARLDELATLDPAVRVVRLRRNYGQTAAMAAGFDHARGEVIIPIDGDCQNDPADIGLLLEKIDEGYDVVSGWRQDRQDGPMRRIPSRIANWLIGRVTGVRLHDYGCTLKAYRAEVVAETRLYGDMHRFLPALASMAGADIVEVPVRHHPRTRGKSKYGLRRTFGVILDLVTVKFLSAWSTKPSHVFGGSGLALCLAGTGFIVWTAYQRVINDIYVYRQPSLLVGVFLFTIGFNLLLLGLLAELIVRTHHESESKSVYVVKTRRNFEESSGPH